MIELRYPPAVLVSRVPCQVIEASSAQCFVRQGMKIDDVDLFRGVSDLVGSGVSNAGRPRLPLPLIISLLSLNTHRTKATKALSTAGSRRPHWNTLLVRNTLNIAGLVTHLCRCGFGDLWVKTV